MSISIHDIENLSTHQLRCIASFVLALAGDKPDASVPRQPLPAPTGNVTPPSVPDTAPERDDNDTMSKKAARLAAIAKQAKIDAEAGKIATTADVPIAPGSQTAAIIANTPMARMASEQPTGTSAPMPQPPADAIPTPAADNGDPSALGASTVAAAFGAVGNVAGSTADAAAPPTAPMDAGIPQPPKDAPNAPADSSPAPAAPSESVQIVDKDGIPWDERIHASSKVKIADGTWRKKKGVTPELYNQIRNDLATRASVAPADASTIPLPPGTVRGTMHTGIDDAMPELLLFIAENMLTIDDIKPALKAIGAPNMDLVARAPALIKLLKPEIQKLIDARNAG